MLQKILNGCSLDIIEEYIVAMEIEENLDKYAGMYGICEALREL